MKQCFKAFPHRPLLFTGFAALVLLSSAFDIVEETTSGESIWEMIDDILIFLVSAFVLWLFLSDYMEQHRSLGSLEHQLRATRGKLQELDAEAASITSRYRAVMQKQFDQWSLTPTEQQIAMTLIKGLSFREVAELRNTREKTVRQQAANIYKKAGLSGRHELAGWFFEDLLNPEQG